MSGFKGELRCIISSKITYIGCQKCSNNLNGLFKKSQPIQTLCGLEDYCILGSSTGIGCISP